MNQLNYMLLLTRNCALETISGYCATLAGLSV